MTEIEKKDAYNIDFDRIKELINKYNKIKESGEIKKYNEESTRKDFIEPLFEALGWNVYNREGKNNSVSAEEAIGGKRVDYGFRINGMPKFFLEAKSLRENGIQANPKYINQAVNYAWWKSCSWAILTNFETIALFNADFKASGGNFRWALHPDDFLTSDKFLKLSKKSFENNELGEPLKNPIDKKLLDDMIHFRDILSKDIRKNNQDMNLSDEKIDEAVQRILDRLIFIRNAEDRKLEETKLQSYIRQPYKNEKGQLVEEVSNLYADYNNKYNSKLFDDHLCDHIHIDNNTLREVINGLYNPSNNFYKYDFSVIESDVLGKIYEQYLGYILNAKVNKTKLLESKPHRKDQGIYYTPSYIVDYIVKNTVGKYIKTHTPEEIKNVKILDPACGSGSFLIKAYKELENYWENVYRGKKGIQETLKLEGAEEFYTRKVEILMKNIFGVDLDPKAVEIAQLNLLLQISEKKQKLPLLKNNIKVGNSLIDDTSISDNAFKWEEEFPEIMKNGGFDIIIGNPPYDVKLNETEKDYIKDQFVEDNTKNSASYFTFRSIELLRHNGIIGMIVPKQLTYITSWDGTRDLLLKNEIAQIIDVSKAFSDVELEQVVIIVMKQNPDPNSKVFLGFSNENVFNTWQANRKWLSRRCLPLWITDDNTSIFEKIIRKSKPLSSIAKVNWGGPVAKYLIPEKKDNTIPCIRGKDVHRYRFDINWFIPNDKIINTYYVKGEKIILQRIVSRFGKTIISNYRNARIVGTYTNDEYYADKTVTLIRDSKIDLKYLTGILNSKLISWFAHRYIYNRSQLTMEFMYDYARSFPICVSSSSNIINNIIEDVDKILKNMNILFKIETKYTDKWKNIWEKTEELSREVDQLVYNIYGLNKKEIQIIEDDYAYWPLS